MTESEKFRFCLELSISATFIVDWCVLIVVSCSWWLIENFYIIFYLISCMALELLTDVVEFFACVWMSGRKEMKSPDFIWTVHLILFDHFGGSCIGGPIVHPRILGLDHQSKSPWCRRLALSMGLNLGHLISIGWPRVYHLFLFLFEPLCLSSMWALDFLVHAPL